VDAIVVEGLRKRYGDVQALDGATFGVREGEIFALLGPNGAGKSTAVRVLVTLTQPDAGTARVAGHDAVGDAGAVRRLIGYVPQESGVDRRATGRENLQLQGRVYGMKRADLRRRIDKLLEIVGITDAADRTVDGYSGGMRRRLDIALGLVHRPRVLFLDEPTTGLDPEARVSMWEEVGRLASQESLTILLTTHYLEEADELADRLAIVSHGRVVAQGTPNELKSRLIGDAVHVELADGRMEDARRVLESVEAPVETTLADGRTLICGSPTADTRCRGSSLPSRAKEFPSRRCRSTGRASTTSTCTTPAATSPPRTAACEGGARNLLREPIWIAILLVQPMVWLLLYGQLFENVTRLGGFRTASYITFLAPAIVVMNAFFSASWSGMSMVFDIERKFVERFLATPASRLSLVLSQIVRSALTAAIQGVIILLVASSSPPHSAFACTPGSRGGS
jgi:ABC-2 type transport system ATP-binding protein